jgi:AraC-like DNA-binding protein
VHYLHLSPKFFDEYFDKLTQLPTFLNLFEIEPSMRVIGKTYRHLRLEEAPLKEVTTLIESLSCTWQFDPASKLILEGYMIILLTILCREYEKLQTIIGKNASNDKFFMDTITYMVTNYNKQLTIDELSKNAGLSRTAFIKRFRDTTGMSPKQFVTYIRISEAKKLWSSNLSITKIAEKTGFYDSAHFMKTFTAVTGLSPSEYRNTELSKGEQYKPLIN